MKKIFVIDWLLLPSFVLSAYSGIELHVAAHGLSHDVWHQWAVFHVLSSFLFLAVSALHVSTHWGWYKGALRKGLGRKSRVTAVLSAVFLLVSVTGIALLGVEGANSGLGMWHYRIGLFTAAISLGHIIKRVPLLRKSLKSIRK